MLNYVKSTSNTIDCSLLKSNLIGGNFWVPLKASGVAKINGIDFFNTFWR